MDERKYLDEKIFLEKYIKKIILISFILNTFIYFLNPVTDGYFKGIALLNLLYSILISTSIFIIVPIFFIFSKYRSIYFTIYSIIWTALGITNSLLVNIRGTVLTKYDFGMLVQGIDVIKEFINIKIISIILIFLISSIILIILVSKKSRKLSVLNFKFVILKIILILFFSVLIISSSNFINKNHISDYSEFGFIYGFTENIISKDVKRPLNYSQKNITDIKKIIDDKYKVNKEYETPNIVAVQLESYFDPKEIEGLKLTENPTPFFDKLKNEFTNGYLKVPTLGGGTARTEFEFITGVDIDSMADGIIPHKKILKDRPFISSVYPMKSSGYTTHFVHNFGGYFYDRDIVYKNLGFDTFTSLEFLRDASIDPNLIKGSRDSIFASEISKKLKSTKGPDFIFNVTAQLHGNYESDYSEYEHNIKASGNFNKEQLGQINDYVNEIKSVDLAMEDIIKEVSKIKEPTIVIFYSDHLPPLNYSNTGLEGEELFKAPYVVWDNLGLKEKDKDVEAYKILSEYMAISGIEGNYINKLQSLNIEGRKYHEYQEMIQYDLIKGKNYINEKFMPTISDMKLGNEQLKISSSSKDGITYTFKGEGFTPMTKLLIDEKICGIDYIDENTIEINTNENLSGKLIYAFIQVGSNENSRIESNKYRVK